MPCPRLRLRRACLLLAALVALAAPALARADGPNAIEYLSGCATNQLARNDDGSTASVATGFTLDFLGQEYASLYVNNNGNVTFDSPLSTYTPFPLSTTSRVIVAPFFGDVDTRPAGSNVVTYGQTVTLDGHKAFCVLWAGVDGVGYYDQHADKLNSFQLLLIDRSDVAPGDFDIELNYDKIQWETGDASGGVGGLGGASARMGWSNGDPESSYEQPGSGDNGAFLDSSPTGLVHGSLGSDHLGRYVFAVRSGRVIQGGGGPSRPLIVVPGTTGTYLQNPGGEVWPNIDRMLLPGGDGYLDALQLTDSGLPTPDPDHQISIEAGKGLNGVIDRIQVCALPFGIACLTSHHYDETKSALEALGYRYDATPDADTTLFFFPYDWRLNAAYIGTQLRDFIAQVKQLTGADSVDILAHSQGGLVAQAALSEGAARNVHRVVTLGTPYLGTPKFLDVLEYAQPCLVDIAHHCWLNQGEVQKLVRNFLGSNELLPSRAYYDLISTTPIRLIRDGSNQQLDYDLAFAKLVEDGHANPDMLNQAQQWHATWDADPNGLGVPILRLAGIKDPTVKQAVDVDRLEPRLVLGIWTKLRVRYVKYLYGSGDGTVVYPSAELVNCERGIDRNDASAQTYASFVRGVSHDDLAHDPTVLASAVAFLRDGRRPSENCPGTISGPHVASRTAVNDATAGLDATSITAYGPLSTRIDDGTGAWTGDVPGEAADAADDIPGSAFDASDGAATASVTGDGVYTGTWTATGDGDARLQVQVYDDDQIVGTAVSPTVTLQAGAILHAVVSRPGPLDGLVLQVDDDGNGTVDRTLPFGPALAGAAANDLTPPTSTVSVTHYTAPDGTRMAHVEVSAADEAGAGVAEIRYTLNAARATVPFTGLYTEPLDLPAKGEISVTAVDAAGNVQTDVTMGVLDDHPSAPWLVTQFDAPHLNATGWIDYQGDTDYWGIDAPAGRLQAQLVALDRDYDLALCDADGNVLASSETRGNASEKIDFAVPAAGHYLLRVTGYAGAWSDVRPYRINVNELGG
ncbi:MAG TPA: nidogen-like domain-containing protein [Gaiellaceae bacterium]|nr:nidogen-like domain-containing protein [Gaiellaceae bacterium]